MKSYGITKSNVNNSEFDKHMEEFYILGYTIIENVLTNDTIDSLRNELDRVYEVQKMEVGSENLKNINEENLVRLPLAYSELFKNLSGLEELRPYLKSILGDYYILHLQNGIINKPSEEHHQSSWHRDLPYQNWVSSEPLACNLYFCLDDFNNNTGATFVLPFSHKQTSAPSKEYIDKNSIQVVAKAGSVILFDSMIFHKAGFNKTKDITRRGINHVYVKPIFAQQINVPKSLGGKYIDDPYFSMLFGYQNQIPESVVEYRLNRISRSSLNKQK